MQQLLCNIELIVLHGEIQGNNGCKNVQNMRLIGGCCKLADTIILTFTFIMCQIQKGNNNSNLHISQRKQMPNLRKKSKMSKPKMLVKAAIASVISSKDNEQFNAIMQDLDHKLIKGNHSLQCINIMHKIFSHCQTYHLD